MRNLLLLVTIFTAIALTTGCGDGKLATIKVSGTVTYDGAPLAGAAVSFSPKGEGHPAYGFTDDNGYYILQTQLGNPDAGTTPGEYEVTIRKRKELPDNERRGVIEAPSIIPERYENPAMSGLTATVEKGKENVFDFTLTK